MVTYVVVTILSFISIVVMSIPYVRWVLASLCIASAVLADLVVDEILYKQRGLGDVLDYLQLTHSEKNVFANSGEKLFSDFKSSMKPTGNGIICFWNDVDKNTLDINISSSLILFVFVAIDKKPAKTRST